MNEWFDVPRTEVDIQYDKAVEDGVRAGSKTRFDPTKLIKIVYSVDLYLYTRLCLLRYVWYRDVGVLCG